MNIYVINGYVFTLSKEIEMLDKMLALKAYRFSDFVINRSSCGMFRLTKNRKNSTKYYAFEYSNIIDYIQDYYDTDIIFDGLGGMHGKQITVSKLIEHRTDITDETELHALIKT